MNWPAFLHDQLPLLLVISPLIGYLVTHAAACFEPQLIRYFAIANSVCTLLLFMLVAWQYGRDIASDQAFVRTFQASQNAADGSGASSNSIQEKLDRRRVDWQARQWFVADGTNLWPSFFLIAVTALIVWQARDSVSLIPLVMVFESISLCALLSYDLRVFLLTSAISAVLLTSTIGAYGGTNRRSLAGRFLVSQLCGQVLILLGMAMLVVGVPWMKMEDSPTLPHISWNIAGLVYEIQKWTGRNELSLHYSHAVFPWMLLLLSLGFMIQAGLFPFHSCQVKLLSESHPCVSLLYLASPMSIAAAGWLRFVLPLAPVLLADFAEVIFVLSVGGAIVSSMQGLRTTGPRRQTAFVFVGCCSLSLLGCYVFSSVGISSGWLMLQQLTVTLCASTLWFDVKWFDATIQAQDGSGDAGEMTERTDRSRKILLCFSIAALGQFASGSIILAELLRANLFVLGAVCLSAGLVLFTAFSVMTGRLAASKTHVRHGNPPTNADIPWLQGTAMPMLLMAATVNLCPQLLLIQCEPEVSRIFREFEQDSEVKSVAVQTSNAVMDVTKHPSR